jgi:hypothetical protein
LRFRSVDKGGDYCESRLAYDCPLGFALQHHAGACFGNRRDACNCGGERRRRTVGPAAPPRISSRAEAPGGFISLRPIRWVGRPFLVASTGFKPVFQAANCSLKAYPLDRGFPCVPEEIGPLPYTHRLGLAEVGGKTCLLASTLCGGKRFQDDWSSPGGVHLAVLPETLDQGAAGWKFHPICMGLSKNHGMDPAVLVNEKRGFLLSAHEGLFFLSLPQDSSGAWERETLASEEYSDAYAGRWDESDETTVFSLSPFHGNVLSIHRRTSRGWARQTIDDSIGFGHVVWAGMFLGRPGILVGARAGRKELVLYRGAAGGVFVRELIDEGAGPSQIAVVDRGRNEAVIFACAHARGEVVCYTISS